MLKHFCNKQLERINQFMRSSTLLNSHNINKCILILILGANDFVKWLIWLVYSYHLPAYQHWINAPYYSSHVAFLVWGWVVFWLFIGLCYVYRQQAWVKTYMPYIATAYLCLAYLYNGYAVGIMSPATIAGYVNLVSLGLVLFSRKLVYSILIPITILILVLIVISAFEYIPYAPLFSNALNDSVLYKNTYWVFSMMFLYIPIFFTSVVIFEILLLQWRNRENLVNEISQKDPLTGLFNRRVLDQNLAQLESDYAVMLIDLDYFKSINDKYGHDIGDHVLRRVAKVLNANIRGSDLAGRFGGEEFMLILQAKSMSQVMTVAERCCQQIELEQFALNDQVSLKVTASFGIAFAESGMAQEQVIKQADQALYQAKAHGRNQIKVYVS